MCEGRYSRSPDELQAKSDDYKLLEGGGEEIGQPLLEEADAGSDAEMLASSLPGQNRRSDQPPGASPGGHFEAELAATPGGIFDLFHVRRRRKR